MLPPRFPVSAELAVILSAALLLAFISPVADWWASPTLGWLTPYALWLLIIVAAILIHRGKDLDEP